MARDSAGISIVENTGPTWHEGREWRLEDEPVLDIGVMQGESAYQLYNVTAALQLDDGRIVVGNSGSSELRFYDAEGHFITATGRSGAGPGEFEGLAWIQQTSGDSLLAYDWRNRRVSVFDDQGNFARTFGLRVLDELGGFPIFSGVFPDGTLFLATDMALASGQVVEGAKRDSAIYYRCAPDGSVIDTLAVLPGGESYQKTDGDNWIGIGVVFGKIGQAAVSGAGFYYGSADRYEINYYDMAGRLQRIIRLELPNIQVTRADIDAYIAERLENARDERGRQIYQRLFADMPFPDDMPAYGQFLADSQGNLWVNQAPRPGDDRPRWKIFDPEGSLLGELETPAQFTIYQIGADFMLGSWRDEFDVEHVRLYELIKH